jgi:uncharacterized membrane protein
VSQRVKAVAVALPAQDAAPIEGSATAAVTSVRGQRIHFVDLLRLIASLQMVHGHTMDALMADELRHGTAFERWSWGRGLVSVAFLFAAGLSYHLSTLACFDRHRGDRSKVLRRFRRAGWLIALGYLLHFPVAAFSSDPAAATRALHELAMVDVLQCIGVCIALLELMTIAAKGARQVVFASAILAVLTFTLAPLGERLDPAGALRPLVNYATHQGGSLFPFLPWASYLFAGVVVGEIALPRGTRTRIDLPLPRLAACSAAVLLIALLAQLSSFSLVTEHTSRNAEPAFNLLKLGVVLAIVTALAWLGRHIRSLPRVFQVLAGETLVIYVVHLLIVYGALRAWFGHTLPVTVTIPLGFAIAIAMAFVGVGWFRFKRRRAERARG